MAGKNLLAEVCGCPFLYEQAFGWKERRVEIDQALDYFEDSYTLELYWMSMLDMGPLIASCYRVVAIFLSRLQCLSFLPLYVLGDDEPTNVPEIAIGLVNDNHFIQLRLALGHPMPPVAQNWHTFAVNNA